MPFYGLTHSLTFLLPTTTGQAALVRLAYPLLDMALLTMAGRARTLRLPAPLATTAARRVHLRRAALAVAAGAATAARSAARVLRARAPVAPRPLTLVLTLTPTLTKTLPLILTLALTLTRWRPALAWALLALACAAHGADATPHSTACALLHIDGYSFGSRPFARLCGAAGLALLGLSLYAQACYLIDRQRDLFSSRRPRLDGAPFAACTAMLLSYHQTTLPSYHPIQCAGPAAPRPGARRAAEHPQQATRLARCWRRGRRRRRAADAADAPRWPGAPQPRPQHLACGRCAAATAAGGGGVG